MRENVRDCDRLEHIVEAANNIFALSPRQISRYTGLPEDEIEDL